MPTHLLKSMVAQAFRSGMGYLPANMTLRKEKKGRPTEKYSDDGAEKSMPTEGLFSRALLRF